jgi:hypothetical protein
MPVALVLATRPELIRPRRTQVERYLVTAILVATIFPDFNA